MFFATKTRYATKVHIRVTTTTNLIAGPPNNNFNNNNNNEVQTECPSGTKCVRDDMCDENAVMVSYRVRLTPDQKARRGNLIVSFVPLTIRANTDWGSPDALKEKKHLCH